MKETELNAENQQLNKHDVSNSSLDKNLVEQRCKTVLEYLFPKHER